MRLTLMLAGVLMAAAFWPAAARAQAQPTEADRLRDAIRGLTAQVRSLEDQNAASRAKIAQAEQEKRQTDQTFEKMRAELREAQKQQQTMIEEFNQKLGERDQVLERWKSAYGQAADVARDKEAQRATLEGEATEYKARTKSCEAKNAQLLKISKEIVAGYRDLNLGKAFLITEPLIGIGRVEHQNRVQDFQDRILDQDVAVPSQSSQPSPSAQDSGNKKADSKQAKAGGMQNGRTVQQKPRGSAKQEQR